MPHDTSKLGGPDARRAHAHTVSSDGIALRGFCIGIAVCWCVLFVALALRYDLQLYGDGALFSYAIAVQEAWGFHWHNISGRVFVYLFAHVPAELYQSLTGNVHGAIALYGLLFFSAPLLGLAATYALDRTYRRTLFAFACISTSCLLPLVFGFPTEMWIAHAIFWPLLALCHCADETRPTRIALTLGFAALVLSHGGGVVFALAILASLALRGYGDRLLKRAIIGFLFAMGFWALAQLSFKPDRYIAEAISNAAFTFIDARNLTAPVVQIIAAALLVYGLAYLLLRRLAQDNAHLKAAAAVTLGLALYWLHFDRSLLAEMRYPLRTALLVFTPVLGGVAAARALHASGELRLPIPQIDTALDIATRRFPARFLAGALMLVTFVHAVETAKFTVGWTSYKQAVRDLAMGTTSNPELGNPRFTSAARIGEERNQLSWGSTTHFLSVLLAPSLTPRRLVVDPDTNYFWLSCKDATANMVAHRAVPVESRQLIRAHACAHR